MSCDRCGFTYYHELREDGTHSTARLGQTFWCLVDGQRIRICLKCVAELRQRGSKVEVR